MHIHLPGFSAAAWRNPAWIRGRGWGAWFRILGHGLMVSDAKRSEALFAERCGHRKAHYLFGIRFERLRPELPQPVIVRTYESPEEKAVLIEMLATYRLWIEQGRPVAAAPPESVLRRLRNAGLIGPH